MHINRFWSPERQIANRKILVDRQVRLACEDSGDQNLFIRTAVFVALPAFDGKYILSKVEHDV